MKSQLLIALSLMLFSMASRAVDCTPIETPSLHATVCRVDVRREHLQLFLRDGTDAPFNSFAAIERWLAPQGRHLQFAMNAGMYRPDYLPSGLFVAEGKQLAPLETRNGHGNFFLKPNGVFLVSERGARVVETSDYPRLQQRVLLATQSGPLLLHRGRIHPGFKADSASRLIRNGVGVTAEGEAVFAISDTPVNFYEFARLFRDRLHCPDALYLDGNVSSLHARALGRSDRNSDLGPIIGVTEPDRAAKE